ncbi:vacuolar fusion protein CCZ1 homolog [Liolophura sinensis]|uniref:vacuolar fusion protein CCZ1 homolog n=1 Tax=Liolophura sinensis TaxID=3198878 RepID=UPI003159052A
MGSKTLINLVNFFIFNSEYGPREGEEEKKIMFYFPKDTDIDSKIKNVGLCEALIKFAETFSDKPCESLHTMKTRQLFLEAEKDFWVIMTVSIPVTEKVSKDGITYNEYHEEDVQDSVFEAVLRQSYRMFTLFNGTFTSILSRTDVNGLQQRLDHFFSRYLLTLKVEQSDILDVFNGIHFLPLDKNTYLRIQCFINQLEANFPTVKYTTFLYSDQLVWSGLEQDDMRIIYRYLTTSLFPNYMEQELHAAVGNSTKPAIPLLGVSAHYGKFITGPPNMKDTEKMGKIPRVYVNTERPNEDTLLLVYKALSASVCLFIRASNPPTFDLCQKLDTFLGPQLTALASDIGEQYSKRTGLGNLAEPQYRYIYFNHMNLAQKTTVHTDSKKSANIHIPPETLKLLGDINSDLTWNDENGETVMKTLTDCWVVGKKSDQREFYVVLNQKNANLIEINEEVKRLCATHFNSIFFLE